MCVSINLQQAKEILEMFGGEDSIITIVEGSEGHSGKGIYAYFEEYPEEGAELIPQKDEEHC